VWETYQIERLLDSLIRGYPIGSFLFWQVRGTRCQEYQFYEFIRNYHHRDNSHNQKANVSGLQELTAILDGQQRLTALYIGLKGSYATKAKYRRRTSADAYPVRRLYLNLLSGVPSDEGEEEVYDVRFLTDEEAVNGPNKHWFLVGRVLDFDGPMAVQLYLTRAKIADSEFAVKALFQLHAAIVQTPVIDHYLEKDQDLDRVLKIFIRVNSGGTQLSYSDLLLSTATAQWKKLDARETINALVKELNGLDQRFSFDKDLVMKACLVLADIPNIRFKVTNFNSANMSFIEDRWQSIADPLRMAVSLVASFGFNGHTLTSANAVIPIAYYLLKRDLPVGFVQSNSYREDRVRIRKWLVSSLLRGGFAAASDTVLADMRKKVTEAPGDGFPEEALSRGLTQMDEGDLEDLLDGRYGEKQTFSVLSMLYPWLDYRNLFDQDHVHPRVQFTRKKLQEHGVPPDEIEFCLRHADNVPNLQLLERTPNQEKSAKAFVDWLNAEYPSETERHAYGERHFIPDTDLRLANFKQFYELRKALMLKELGTLLLPASTASA
jgi:hypothetical protein